MEKYKKETDPAKKQEYMKQSMNSLYRDYTEVPTFKKLSDKSNAESTEEIERIDELVGKAGNPVGVAAYEPYDADGEDQVYNYMGNQPDIALVGPCRRDLYKRDLYNHKDAEGFITLFGLPIKVQAMVDAANEAKKN